MCVAKASAKREHVVSVPIALRVCVSPTNACGARRNAAPPRCAAMACACMAAAVTLHSVPAASVKTTPVKRVWSIQNALAMMAARASAVTALVALTPNAVRILIVNSARASKENVGPVFATRNAEVANSAVAEVANPENAVRRPTVSRAKFAPRDNVWRVLTTVNVALGKNVATAVAPPRNVVWMLIVRAVAVKTGNVWHVLSNQTVAPIPFAAEDNVYRDSVASRPTVGEARAWATVVPRA